MKRILLLFAIFLFARHHHHQPDLLERLRACGGL